MTTPRSTAEDIVVEAAHRELVLAELAALGVGHDPAAGAEDRTLGLALLAGLTGLPRLRTEHPPARPAAHRPYTDLDVLLETLRIRFAARYGGWVPELGRNRQAAPVLPAGPGRSEPMAIGATGSVVTIPAGRTLTAKVARVDVKDGDAPVRTFGPGRGRPMDQKILVTIHSGDLLATGTLSGGPGLADDVPTGTGPEPAPLTVAPGTAPADPAAGAGVVVGLVDTPPFPDDPDGAPREAVAAHSGFVAGLIAAHAPAAELVLEPVLAGAGGRASLWDTATAMARLVGRTPSATVLNLSLGCRTEDGRPPFVLARAVERLAQHAVLVAAAGNHGGSERATDPVWPAALPGVIAVGAHDGDGVPAPFSPRLPWVTVTAPGVSVPGPLPKATLIVDDGSAVEFDGLGTWSGTSFAAAAVTGLLAALGPSAAASPAAAVGALLDRAAPLVRTVGHTP
ncbi:MAG TPA: S8/S53 family peptidase [Pseudonocardiaceae bacterium]